MLNRKASNLIFYGILVGLAIIVIIIRVILLGTINGRIDDVVLQSQQQQAIIDMIDDIVAENRDKQEEHLYQLYAQVPQEYDYFQLSFKTASCLELAGITEESIIERSVTIDTEPTFPTDSVFTDAQDNFDIVKIYVYFNTDSEIQVDEFITYLYDDEQLFIVSEIKYTTPDGTNLIGVQVNFLAFYEKTLEESEN